MALEATAEWRGYNYGLLHKGKVYDIEYTIKSPTEILVTCFAGMSKDQIIELTYTSPSAFAASWKIAKKKTS